MPHRVTSSTHSGMAISKESVRLTFIKIFWRKAILRGYILINKMNTPTFLCYNLHNRFSYYPIFETAERIHGRANMAVQESDMIDYDVCMYTYIGAYIHDMGYCVDKITIINVARWVASSSYK